MNFLKQNLQLYCFPMPLSLQSSFAGFSSKGISLLLPLGSPSAASSSSVKHEDSEEDAGEDPVLEQADEDDLMDDLENGGGSMFFTPVVAFIAEAEKWSILVTDCSCSGKTASM